MASILTQNAFKSIYDYMFRVGALIGTATRPAVVLEEISDAVHSGIAFQVDGRDSLTNGSSFNFMAKVGALPLHFIDFTLVTTDGEVILELYENPTITSNGTAVASNNKNRSSTNTSLTACYGGTTASSNGTLIARHHILGSGQGAFTAGGSGGFGGEWLLKPNEDYLFKITNSSGSTIQYSVSFYYFEK